MCVCGGGGGVGPSYEGDGVKVYENAKLNYYRKPVAVIMCLRQHSISTFFMQLKFITTALNWFWEGCMFFYFLFLT